MTNTSKFNHHLDETQFNNIHDIQNQVKLYYSTQFKLYKSNTAIFAEL